MAQNDDQLQQQYQEILNKYASSLTPTPEETPPVLDLTLSPEKSIENKEIITPIVNPTIPPEPVLPVEPKPLFIPPVITQKPNPPIYFPKNSVPDQPSNFFKYLFYFSLLLFIAVASAVVYNLTSNLQSKIPIDRVTTPTPIKIVSQFCELNDKKYVVGESFPSTDSCNTCSCTPNLTIDCTLMACISPTPIIKLLTKIYKDIKYNYQFECPTTTKYVVEATSVNGNKIPYKQESCTDGELITTVSVYDNTIVHSFGNVETQISPDKKYVVAIEGESSDLLSSIIASFKFL